MNKIHPSLLQRKIIHFDMDAFYAAIEVRDDPRLKAKPVVIGGSPNSRAVVCTASYEARKFGIRSAISCAQAARLCPDAIFIAPNFEKYSAVSQQIRAVFHQYTDLVEPLALDEAFLDVTHNTHGLYAVKIARRIQDEIAATLRLTGSAGVAPNKLLAKIASDMHKPRGITVVLPDQVPAFMEKLPLRRIHGIGPVTEKRLAAFGLNICSDVWRLSLAELAGKVGNMAHWLAAGTRGLDERPVETDSVRKTLGREETFATDLLCVDDLKSELRKLARDVEADLKGEDLRGCRVTLKVRYADFTRITRCLSLPTAMNDAEIIFAAASGLLHKTEAGRRKIRLLGIAVANFS